MRKRVEKKREKESDSSYVCLLVTNTFGEEKKIVTNNNCDCCECVFVCTWAIAIVVAGDGGSGGFLGDKNSNQISKDMLETHTHSHTYTFILIGKLMESK